MFTLINWYIIYCSLNYLDCYELRWWLSVNKILPGWFIYSVLNLDRQQRHWQFRLNHMEIYVIEYTIIYLCNVIVIHGSYMETVLTLLSYAIYNILSWNYNYNNWMYFWYLSVYYYYYLQVPESGLIIDLCN